ncbi:MAG: hypothetical protein JWP75_3520 [Frondihabitans sp.]|nr:hypothetical protein [Frondihabitans sp.]
MFESDSAMPTTQREAPARCMRHFGMVHPLIWSAACPLSTNAKAMYAAMTISASSDDRTGCRRSIKTLARMASMAKSTAEKALKELERAGAVEAVRRHVERGNGVGREPTEWRLRDSDVDIETCVSDDGEWIGWPSARRGNPRDGLPLSRETGHPSPVSRATGSPGDGSEQYQVAGQGSRTTEQYQLASLATPDARARAAADPVAKVSAIRRICRGVENTVAWASTPDEPEPVDTFPGEWKQLLDEIPSDTTDLDRVMHHYWNLLVASGKPRYPDQIHELAGMLLVLVQKHGSTAVIEGITWLFGGSNAKYPHKAGAVEQYVEQYVRSRRHLEADDSDATKRMKQACTPHDSRFERPATIKALAERVAERAEQEWTPSSGPERALEVAQKPAETPQALKTPPERDPDRVAALRRASEAEERQRREHHLATIAFLDEMDAQHGQGASA